MIWCDAQKKDDCQISLPGFWLYLPYAVLYHQLLFEMSQSVYWILVWQKECIGFCLSSVDCTLLNTRDLSVRLVSRCLPLPLLPSDDHPIPVFDMQREVLVDAFWQQISSSSSSISRSRTAHLNCARHRWLLPVNSDILRIFCTVFAQAVLVKVYCSAAYNFTWLGIPGCCYFNWVKVSGNWCVEMFYNKFCSIVSCSVIKIIIKEPSCTGWKKSPLLCIYYY